MPKLKYCYPKMCRDRNQAFSWYKGKRVYHGVWGSPEAKESYKRFIAALMENPDVPVWDKKSGDALVSELAIAFLKHAESRNMDKVDVAHFKRVIGFLIETYGGLSVNEFSPKKLKVCRTQMVKAGTLCRRMVNDYTRKSMPLVKRDGERLAQTIKARSLSHCWVTTTPKATCHPWLKRYTRYRSVLMATIFPWLSA